MDQCSSDNGDDDQVYMEEMFDLCDTSKDEKLEMFEFEKCYIEACSEEIGTNPNAECTGYSAS
jgi:hypothetical protein